ncbi:serine hydrolase domain-containing protein [Sinimarinibacterium sp. CAU 1509]|uniref:serine hydrolase domain-containing protein n=1 Tax=Sinimarinibacterium sp. CAU 1509 TaxID=2562283 RepID=UPI00146ECDBA|nr:serine hydrolase domain-containing protein [Sinimarinibacterium sp. CAU 1509]
MKFLSAMLFAVVLTACGQQAPNAPNEPDQVVPADPARWSAVDQTLDAYLLSSGGPLDGYGFAVFNRDGLLHTRYGGRYSGETVVMLASASKGPAAAAVLTLVDAGLLDLDAPVARYIEQAGAPIIWPADKQAITMRMLLAHTSGLAGNELVQAPCLYVSVTITLQQCAQQIAQVPIQHEPGTTFSYGGADYQVAGYVATLIAGMDWIPFFDQAIAAPLNLDTFTYGDPKNVTNPRIAGGARSNLADYARIMQMLHNDGELDGIRVMSPATVAMLKVDQIDEATFAYGPFSTEDQAKFNGYSLGFWISDPHQHPGSRGPELSDPGLFGTTGWIDADPDYGAVILIESNTSTGLEMWSAVRPQLISLLR